VLPPLESVIKSYQAAYNGGQITNADLVAKFEGAVAERLGARHCVAVSSCTCGLMMVLRALDLAGEVIVPSFTFFATGHALIWNGLQPVFADCDPHTWTVNVEDVERKITGKTVAILAVHLYGNPCDITALTRVASRYRLKLVFDAAHAFGSSYRSRPVGQFGDAEVFSLSPTKLLVAGEGGLVTTNDPKLAQAVRAMRNYGDTGAYDPDWFGMNARMPEFNAALGLEGLQMIEEKIKRRHQIANMYTSLLSLPGASFQQVHPQDVHTYKDYSIHVNPELFGLSRDELATSLLAENIDTKKYFYPPLHLQKLYRPFHDAGSNNLQQTERVTSGILSLPIYESLPDSTIEDVAHAIRRLARHAAMRTDSFSSTRHHHAAIPA
jgi:dTDP-4-amino-4,6-dideoxygalactose transaminase